MCEFYYALLRVACTIPCSLSPSCLSSLAASCLISPSQPIVSHICKPPRQAKLAHVVPGACACIIYEPRKEGNEGRGDIFWRMLSCLSKVAAARVVAANELLPLRRKPCSSNNNSTNNNVSNY